ncbi:MAG: alpha/beta hydrolase [Acidobacteriota bacterium]
MLMSAVVLLAVAVARAGDGVPIHYLDQGKGEPALVFVHCWSCDRHIWDAQVSAFSKDHRVIALDLAGHGESGRKRNDWTPPAFGGDVAAVVEKAGLKRVILVGSSMGGNIILEAARRLGDRVAGFVFVDTLTDFAQKTPPEQIEAVVQHFKADYKNEAASYINHYLFSRSTPPSVRKRVLAEAASAPPGISIAVLRGAMEYDPVPALRQIKVPIHAINSDLFPTNVEGNRKYAPQFQAVIMKGSGHYPMMEDPARFNALLADAIRDAGK